MTGVERGQEQSQRRVWGDSRNRKDFRFMSRCSPTGVWHVVAHCPNLGAGTPVQVPFDSPLPPLTPEHRKPTTLDANHLLLLNAARWNIAAVMQKASAHQWMPFDADGPGRSVVGQAPLCGMSTRGIGAGAEVTAWGGYGLQQSGEKRKRKAYIPNEAG